MKHQRLIGLILLIIAFMAIIGMLINNPIYWLIVDVAVIIVCSGSGLYLLRKKQN